MRRLLRNAAEASLIAAGAAARARRSLGDSIAILAYHNVVPDGEAGRADASLHLPMSAFIQQIERLAKTHHIVDIETIREPDEGGRPRAVITFDDAYRGAVLHALPELALRGIPAVVFVAPGLLGSNATWWDELAAAGMLSDDVRTSGLEQLAGIGGAVRDQYPVPSVPELPRSYGISSESELLAHCVEGIRIGSHSWGHEYLPALGDAALAKTLEDSHVWVIERGRPATGWLALPYGGSSERVTAAALRCGYSGVLRIDGGLHRGARTAETPRINVPAGLTLRGFELRTSGIFDRR